MAKPFLSHGQFGPIMSPFPKDTERFLIHELKQLLLPKLCFVSGKMNLRGSARTSLSKAPETQRRRYVHIQVVLLGSNLLNVAAWLLQGNS